MFDSIVTFYWTGWRHTATIMTFFFFPNTVRKCFYWIFYLNLQDRVEQRLITAHESNHTEIAPKHGTLPGSSEWEHSLQKEKDISACVTATLGCIQAENSGALKKSKGLCWCCYRWRWEDETQFKSILDFNTQPPIPAYTYRRHRATFAFIWSRVYGHLANVSPIFTFRFDQVHQLLSEEPPACR